MGSIGAYRQTLRRLRWRLGNLSATEAAASCFPRTVRIRDLDLADLAARRSALRAPARFHGRPHPFLIIKPEGLPLEERIREALAELSIRVVSEHAIADYAGLQLALHALHHPREAPVSGALEPADSLLRLALRLEADRIRCTGGGVRGKALLLEGEKSAPARRIKRRLRSRIGPIRFLRVVWRDRCETVFSSYIHIPEPEDLPGEYAVLKEFL